MSYKPRHAKPSKTRRRAAAVLGTAATSAALIASQQPTASALELALPKVPGLDQVIQLPAGVSQSSADLNQQINDQLAQFGNVSRDAAWQLRDALRTQAQALPPQLREQALIAIDSTVEAFFPGLIAQRTQPAPQPRVVEPVTPNNPCPAYADACIDLGKQESWLQKDGKITYGPVPISSGRAGYETPKGKHVVNRKVKDEVSREFNNAPMPNAVYFTDNGIAFHEGDPNIASHGCIHLRHDDSVKYFDTLQNGDIVYVF
ncbi:L,D-transpeptidase [Corynebacterium gerontici]|nr:L,D-transpeptidase [Corynebacterium gerontici]